MSIGYELYKRMGFEEVSEKDGIVSMRMVLENMDMHCAHGGNCHE